MKGTILRICPQVQLIDLTNDISSQDIMEAAFVVREAYAYFPEGAIHLVVVDPGVGTSRPAVALRHNGHYFVGPDNGLFSLVTSGGEPDEVVVLDKPAFWRTPEPSNTFHGRDIFAPVAAHLANGRKRCELGSPTQSLQDLRWVRPIAYTQGLRGWVVHIDHFGNCITNIELAEFEAWREGRGVKVYAGTSILKGIGETYGSVEKGDPVAVFGNSDLLEIAVNGGSAAELLSIRKGAAVSVVFVDKS